MKVRTKQSAQFIAVTLCALALKLHYSTASPDQLRWILAPTTLLVQLLSGKSFEFESYAGYISGDHRFMIAASCAGVNFLITSFLMLCLRTLWNNREQTTSWRFIPAWATFAYVATLITNTVRICVALRLQRPSVEATWLNPGQLHRLEGIIVYFGFLVLVFVLSDTWHSENTANFLRRMMFVLVIYYAVTLGIPIVDGAFNNMPLFLEHFAFVFLIPLVTVGLMAAFRIIWKSLITQRWMRSLAAKSVT